MSWLPVGRFGPKRRQVIVGGGRRFFGGRVESSVVVGVFFEPRDPWVGVYHRRFIRGSGPWRFCRDFYACVVPMFPVKVSVSIFRRERSRS